MGFLSGEPIVQLVAAVDRPYETGVAAARTCYSSNGIVLPDDVSRTKKSRELRDRIAASTLQAGHLTTRQHATFVFALDRVSRAVTWSFLHSHPFYNSEQVSQRYVEVNPESVLVPDLPEPALTIYRSAVDAQMSGYQELIQRMLPTIRDEFHELFPARTRQPERWEKLLLRKAYEVARYVLPVATFTYLYHTVSALTLLRYARTMDSYDTPTEQRMLVRKMLDAAQEWDPLFRREIPDPIPIEETPEHAFMVQQAEPSVADASRAFAAEFDERLAGGTSALLSASTDGEATLAGAVRGILGVPRDRLTDREAIELLLSPSRNPYLAETLGVHSHVKLSRAMEHLSFTFAKKLSHTADSQDQRHRMVPGARPILSRQYTGTPDTIVPKVIRANPDAWELFDRINDRAYEAINRLLELGVSPEMALYLLPNAAAIRFVESGSLMDWHHKWRTRLCYTAQEEIFHASVDEVLAVRARYPTVGAFLHAPCWFRANTPQRPFCPEGDRFCGVPVWKLEPGAFSRVL